MPPVALIWHLFLRVRFTQNGSHRMKVDQSKPREWVQLEVCHENSRNRLLLVLVGASHSMWKCVQLVEDTQHKTGQIQLSIWHGFFQYYILLNWLQRVTSADCSSVCSVVSIIVLLFPPLLAKFPQKVKCH